MISKIHGKIDRYDSNINKHNHIKCIKCGNFQDIDIDVKINEDVVKELGYELSNYKVEINGICNKCQNNK